MMLVTLADIARTTGHPVTEVEGWRNRSRPPNPARNRRGLLSVQTITIHETGLGRVPTTDMPSLAVLTNGRGGKNPLPGPLVQFGIGVSGRIYVIAAGLANHAGESLLTRYTREHAIGIEIEASGLGLAGDFPAIQLDAAARLAAALQAYPWAGGGGRPQILGHKETCAPPGRKVDPHFDMDTFRQRVKRLAGTRLTTKDDDMPNITDEQLDALATRMANKVWARQHALTDADARAYGGSAEKGELKSEEELMRFPPAVARLRRELAAGIGTISGQLGAVVEAIAGAGSLTEVEQTALIKQSVQQSLDELRRRILDDDDPVA